MTTKILSQQLCELCGIEPKIECGFNCPYHDEEAPVCSYQQENNKCYEQYPDFEKPSNFVKLLEIPMFGYSIGYFVFNRWETCNREDFISNLISLIDEYEREKIDYSKHFIKAIKNADWEY